MAPPFRIVTADEVIEMLKGRTYRWAQVHHTWKPNHSDFTGHNHLRLQEGMYNYHTNVRGWSDIGQHLTLMPDGKFVTGRDFDRWPAGIRGWNEDAFMIEHLGDFDVGHDKLEGKQLESSLKVYHYLVTHCGAEILFHREHAAKTCPGSGIDESEFVEAVKHFSGTKHIDYEPKTKAAHTSNGNLAKGDWGEQVEKWQIILKDLGYYGGSIDGIFGRKTEAAVRSFQEHEGIQRDGIIGPVTKRHLEEASQAAGTIATIQSTLNERYGLDIAVDDIPGPETKKALIKGYQTELNRQFHAGLNVDGIWGPKTKAASVNVKEGARGNLTWILQATLYCLGYDPRGLDGIFGSGTEKAVRAFQKDHHLSVDGIAGPNTFAKMFA